MKIADDTRQFTLDGAKFAVRIQASMSDQQATLHRDGVLLGEDRIAFAKDGTRNLCIEGQLPDGRSLQVEAGYINWISVGIAVRVEGVLVHESHPGKVIAWPARFAMKPGGGPGLSAAQMENYERFKRNWPSLLTDIGLGLMFFLIGSAFGLVTAAVVGAVAGVLLWLVQKVTRIDLLGGLAVFGIVVSIVSAGFALAFQDPSVVQMRSTILGLGVAALFFVDGLIFNGRLLGARLERYLPAGTDRARLSIGIGALGAVMAGGNWLVASLFDEQQWLFYTTFLDTPLAMALGIGVMMWARTKRPI